MIDSFSDAIKEAFAIAPTNEVALDTLEIRQEGVQEPIYLVKAARGLVAKDENEVDVLYEASGFQFTMPAKTEEGFASLNVAIDNVDPRVGEFIELALSEEVPVQVIYRPYLVGDPMPQMDPPLIMFLKDIEITVLQVTGKATFMDIVNKKFPNDLYTRNRFPALG